MDINKTRSSGYTEKEEIWGWEKVLFRTARRTRKFFGL
jgi:hypothetical protein